MSLQDIMDALRGRGGRGKRQRREPRPGQDSESQVTLDFLQAARGTTMRLRMSRPNAEGSMDEETLDVKIPPGVQEGSRVRVRGKGEMGEAGAGDLYIVVHVSPHDYFRREADDLYVTVPISITEATLGGKVDVPTLTGRGTVTVPPGTASSRKLRLREKGIQRPGKTPGDLYVVIEIIPPKELTARQRELLEEFRKLDTANPRANCPWS
jgi:curved DNA-binding protein